MEIKTLKKYDRSRLNQSLIKCLVCYPDGKVIVEAENGDTKEFWMGEEVINSNADYIICDLQDEPEIKVSKY